MSLAEKWKVTGLLKDCGNEIEEMVLASLLEDASSYLKENTMSDLSRGILIPVVARIYYATKSNLIDCDELRHLIDSCQVIDDAYTHLDYESEVAVTVSEQYIEAHT